MCIHLRIYFLFSKMWLAIVLYCASPWADSLCRGGIWEKPQPVRITRKDKKLRLDRGSNLWRKTEDDALTHWATGSLNKLSKLSLIKLFTLVLGGFPPLNFCFRSLKELFRNSRVVKSLTSSANIEPWQVFLYLITVHLS